MSKEIEWLAEHDKGFNDGYREYFNSKKQLFGLPDDQIVTSRESLVWKIYAKKHAEAKKNESQNVISPKKSPMKDKENSDPSERFHGLSSLKSQMLRLGKLRMMKPQSLTCTVGAGLFRRLGRLSLHSDIPAGGGRVKIHWVLDAGHW